MPWRSAVSLGLATAVIVVVVRGQAPPYDLVIRNARVVDLPLSVSAYAIAVSFESA